MLDFILAVETERIISTKTNIFDAKGKGYYDFNKHIKGTVSEALGKGEAS